nr:hypothetical protein BDOA9_0203410 [Bradyrhizobium sp. DOA9]
MSAAAPRSRDRKQPGLSHPVPTLPSGLFPVNFRRQLPIHPLARYRPSLEWILQGWVPAQYTRQLESANQVASLSLNYWAYMAVGSTITLMHLAWSDLSDLSLCRSIGLPVSPSIVRCAGTGAAPLQGMRNA